MKKIYIKVACACLFMIGGLIGSGIAHSQSGLADAYCQAYMPVVHQAVDFRRQGIPIDVSLGVADSAFDTNQSLWRWLRSAVRSAYADPNGTINSLRDGSAMRSCVSAVRGF